MSRPWLAVVCPTCAAGEGALCHVDGLGAVAFAHPDRLTAWTTLNPANETDDNEAAPAAARSNAS